MGILNRIIVAAVLLVVFLDVIWCEETTNNTDNFENCCAQRCYRCSDEDKRRIDEVKRDECAYICQPGFFWATRRNSSKYPYLNKRRHSYKEEIPLLPEVEKTEKEEVLEEESPADTCIIIAVAGYILLVVIVITVAAILWGVVIVILIGLPYLTKYCRSLKQEKWLKSKVDPSKQEVVSAEIQELHSYSYCPDKTTAPDDHESVISHVSQQVFKSMQPVLRLWFPEDRLQSGQDNGEETIEENTGVSSERVQRIFNQCAPSVVTLNQQPDSTARRYPAESEYFRHDKETNNRRNSQEAERRKYSPSKDPELLEDCLKGEVVAENSEHDGVSQPQPVSELDRRPLQCQTVVQEERNISDTSTQLLSTQEIRSIPNTADWKLGWQPLKPGEGRQTHLSWLRLGCSPSKTKTEPFVSIVRFH